METEKIGFFKRVKLAIFNLEKYVLFVNEKFSKSLKYLLLLITIVTVFLALASTIDISKDSEKLVNFVKSKEFPNFELADGKLNAESKLNSYDEEFNGGLIIDTTDDLSEEAIEKYKEEEKDNSYSVILLKDKIVYKFDATSEDWLETTYNNIGTTIGINDITKDKLIKDYLNDDTLFKMKVVIFIYSYLSILLLNILTLFEDVLIVGVFGWIASKISGVPLNIAKSMSLAIYSLTLSIILSTIYSIAYTFTGFEIKYFEIMYMIIAYIYIVASIMIMKEGNKTAGEAVTVEGEVLNSSDEEKEENPIEEKKEKKKKKLPEETDKDKEEIPANDEEKNTKKEENSKGDK